MTWNCQDDDGIQSSSLTIDGASVTRMFGPYAADKGVNYAALFGSLPDGQHNYVITATDKLGNPLTPANGTFQVIRSGPAISQIVVVTANGLMTWNVNDPDGIASTSLKVDGAPALRLYGPYEAASGQNYAGTFGTLAPGDHSYVITATDRLGNSSQYNGTVKVDSSRPVISSVVVVPGKKLMTWNLQAQNGIAYTSVMVDGISATRIYGPYAAASGVNYAGTFSTPWTDGNHNYTVTGADKLGKVSQYSGTFTVASAGPAVSHVVVVPGQKLITWNVQDPNGIRTTGVSIDGVIASRIYGPYSAASGWNYAATFNSLPTGTHNYVITATNTLNSTSRYPGTFISTAALMASELKISNEAKTLTDVELTPIIAESERRLITSLGPQASAALNGLSIKIADLSNGMLGETAAMTIRIDRDAAGRGWFVDPTPEDDAEFTQVARSGSLVASRGSEAGDRVDLLTTVMHEMGHVLGYDDTETLDLMCRDLPLGTRRSPKA